MLAYRFYTGSVENAADRALPGHAHSLLVVASGNGPGDTHTAACTCGWSGTPAGNWQKDREAIVSKDLNAHYRTMQAEKLLEDRDCARLDEIAVTGRIKEEVYA